ncbi:methyltransferase domain-containing protein [Uliginosibacterium sp. H3]|uniref:Methyltransferase domain-containing protein n=1 Tax=Uliginosibacterium silvisoli TaxID=3114758 RepID=A0ABU6K923_9RHOO|nr:methyltransferase domain-containing protein [Uliginosibacterium sp. H3]
MQADLHKRAVRTAFSDAAARYNSVAHVQRRIADDLLARCAKTSGLALDAGSGTGYAKDALSELGTSCLALDHAVPMLLQSSGDGVCGDIEALPLQRASVALYFSSLAWQWTDASQSISEAARVLQPGGQLMVATLGPGTLAELREAFAQADDVEHVRRFATASGYAAQLLAAGFDHVDVSTKAFVAHARDFRGMLHEIKTLGAHVVDIHRPRGLFGIQRFRRAENHYEHLRKAAGLPITYEAVFLSARRA